MKLRLMICATVASAALFATDYTGDKPVFGVLGVTDTTSSNTVVGVPWVNAAGEQISLSNLVSTATLAAGDIVYLYESGTWKGYALSATKVWEPMTTINGNDAVSPGAANAKFLSRGTGLIIQRASNRDPIYLCGRYDSSTPSATSVDADATVLIANPALVPNNITTGVVGDQIRVPLNGGALNIYEKGSDGWYETVTDTSWGFPMTRKVKLAGGVPLAPGMGAWYVSKGASSISW